MLKLRYFRHSFNSYYSTTKLFDHFFDNFTPDDFQDPNPVRNNGITLKTPTNDSSLFEKKENKIDIKIFNH